MTSKGNGELTFLKPKHGKTVALPLYASTVSAGFPSPAEDYEEQRLDLNKHLIQSPTATFFVKVRGDSMINAGIRDGSLLIVDKSLTAKNRDVVVCLLDGEFTVKRLQKQGNEVSLLPENPAYKPIVITPENDFQVWGVVAYVIHKP